LDGGGLLHVTLIIKTKQKEKEKKLSRGTANTGIFFFSFHLLHILPKPQLLIKKIPSDT